MQASQAERDAACKLSSKEAGIKITLQYDTTPRNRIDIYYTSIIHLRI